MSARTRIKLLILLAVLAVLVALLAGLQQQPTLCGEAEHWPGVVTICETQP